MSAVNLNRVAEQVNFNTGISLAEYNEAPVGQTPGRTQGEILPGSTTVSEAIEGIFPKDPTVSGSILGMLAAAGNSTALRTANGFHVAARKTIRSLREKGGGKASAAVRELEGLMADTDLLERYRAALLES